jgi:hypothetical protein
VHRWLEERAWALQSGSDPDLVPKPWQAAALLPLLPTDRRPPKVAIDDDAGSEGPNDDPAEPIASDREADALAARFIRSPYASRVPEAAELPVVLTVDGAFVRGTVDTVYVDPSGAWEVVDLKTGPAPIDDAGWLQLEAYALAVADSGRALEGATLTFLCLGGSKAEAISRPARGRAEIMASLHDAVTATNGPYDCVGCRWCQ